MLWNNRNVGLGKDGLSNPVGDVIPNVGSPLQVGGSLLPRGDTDMLIKVPWFCQLPLVCGCIYLYFPLDILIVIDFLKIFLL